MTRRITMMPTTITLIGSINTFLRPRILRDLALVLDDLTFTKKLRQDTRKALIGNSKLLSDLS
jgi:hypothetical protein